MVRTLILFASIISLIACSSSEAIFELRPQQSMSITGKGIGQDAAINPYNDNTSIAVVKSLSKNPFDVRVQLQGEIIDRIKVSEYEEVEIVLEKGFELYLDSQSAAKASVKFKPYSE